MSETKVIGGAVLHRFEAGGFTVWAESADMAFGFALARFSGPDLAPAPTRIARACTAAPGCVQEDGHAMPHIFDFTGRADLAQLGANVGRQLDETARTLRQIGDGLARGLAAWDADEKGGA